MTPAVLFVAIFGLLAAATRPAVPWYDGGELGAAAASLGVAHPTGFPLWILLGKAAALVPLGDMALRLNLLSALLIAGAAATAATVACRMAGGGAVGRTAGAVAALALALGRTASMHGTALEVYALHALTAAGLLLGAHLLSRRGGDRRALPAGALVAGLCLGGHGELRILLLPVAALVLWWRRDELGPRWVGAAAAACMLGLGLHLLLPVRSAAGSPRDWGHPATLVALWDHLQAARIRQAFSERMLRPFGPYAAGDAQRYLGILVAEVGVLLPFAALGAIWVRRRSGARGVVVVAPLVLGIDAAYAILVNPMGLQDLQNGLPGYVAVAVLAGCGLCALPFARTLGVMAVVAVALPHASASFQPGDHGLRRYGAAALAQAGPHGHLLTTSDHLSAALTWLKTAEGARPDARHTVRQHAADEAGLARQAVDESRLRSVRWEHGGGGDEAALEAAGELTPGVPTFGVGEVGTRPADPVRAVVDAVAGILGDPPLPGPGRATAGAHLNQVGMHLVQRRRAAEAGPAFEMALRLNPASVAARVNLGSIASAQGRMEDAVHFTEEALALDPHGLSAWVNLGRYSLALRRNEAAAGAFARALALKPGSAAAHSGMGAVEANRGNRAAAIRHLRRAIDLDPGLREARVNLGLLLRRGSGR